MAQNKKAIKFKDVSGCTPLTVAINRNNPEIARILLKYGSSADIVDKRGKTSRDYARESDNEEIRNIFNSSSNILSDKRRLKSTAAPVDEMRIMQVWEKFFENAYLALEAESEFGIIVDNTNLDSMIARNTRNNANNVDSFKHKSSTSKNGSKQLDLNSREAKKTHEVPVEPVELPEDAVNWFDWILCANPTDCEEYYVVSRQGYFTKWFVELAEEYAYILEVKADSTPEYPLSCEELFLSGWIVFFDENINECLWMQLSSGRVERYLPIGDDVENVVNLGFEFYDGDYQWVRPNQYPCHSSWVVISVVKNVEYTDIDYFYKADDKNSSSQVNNSSKSENSAKNSDVVNHNQSAENEYFDDVYEGYVWNYYTQEWEHKENTDSVMQEEIQWYFYNTFTAQSRWEAPVGWEEMIAQEWNGWWMCRDEISLVDYWYLNLPLSFEF